MFVVFGCVRMNVFVDWFSHFCEDSLVKIIRSNLEQLLDTFCLESSYICFIYGNFYLCALSLQPHYPSWFHLVKKEMHTNLIKNYLPWNTKVVYTNINLPYLKLYNLTLNEIGSINYDKRKKYPM